MRVMESPQQRRTPQQPNFRPIPLNLAPQDPPAQDANNADPFVDVDMNGCGLRLTPCIAGQIAALPPLPVFRRYRAANPGPNVCILFKFNFMTERLLYMFSQCHLSPHCLLLHIMV